MTTIDNSIDFIQFHQPPLKSGEYALTVDQQVTVPEKKGSKTNTTESYRKTQHFYVAGDRFSIKPQEIHSKFPPPGNGGDHSNILPHIILTRSTLPWERAANPDDSELPWLWLFIYDDQDVENGNVKPSKQVAANSLITFLDPNTKKPLSVNANNHWVTLLAEPQENLSEQVISFKASARWLKDENVVPSAAALKLLTSVRGNIDSEGSSEWSVCVANRLPLAGGKTYAHLVTLENRFNSDGFDNNLGIDANGDISFVSLANWDFSCPDDISYVFNDKALEKLQKENIPQSLINDIQKLPKNALYESTTVFEGALATVINTKNQSTFQQQEKNIVKCLQAPTATFKGLLDQINRGSFRLKTLDTTGENSKYFQAANQYICRGAVAMPHNLRSGGSTASWYHGPFIDGADPDSMDSVELPVNLPVAASDQLLRFDTVIGMLDVSYAAAWELGRYLTLNNRHIAMKLYAWKRQHAWDIKQQEQALLYGHLPFAESTAGDKADADHANTLNSWFNELNLLYHVPFNYLIPDAAMLPDESIRFFTIDNAWIECLLDGAFSIGRVTSADSKRDATLSHTAKAQYPAVSGFLLFSEAVSGWPGIQVNASSSFLNEAKMPENNSPLSMLRMERLAPNILLCLFDGAVKTVDIHLAAESLHFGFDRPFSSHSDFYKELKNLQTGEISSPLKTIDISWIVAQASQGSPTPSRVVDIETLSNNIKESLNSSSFCSAQFALEMIEGVPRIRFLVSET
ncbi:hypothetical protein A9Q81_12985 [Gammaproteobacteria bacterium 42_54_T18]|nr:hypothetical protein A9Q81_12985 [Gammaproteobacteria bacterium 42_54_T18]